MQLLCCPCFDRYLWFVCLLFFELTLHVFMDRFSKLCVETDVGSAAHCQWFRKDGEIPNIQDCSLGLS